MDERGIYFNVTMTSGNMVVYQDITGNRTTLITISDSILALSSTSPGMQPLPTSEFTSSLHIDGMDGILHEYHSMAHVLA